MTAAFKPREIQFSIAASDKSRCGGHNLDFIEIVEHY
jgi:hypothetical protein